MDIHQSSSNMVSNKMVEPAENSGMKRKGNEKQTNNSDNIKHLVEEFMSAVSFADKSQKAHSDKYIDSRALNAVVKDMEPVLLTESTMHSCVGVVFKKTSSCTSSSSKSKKRKWTSVFGLFGRTV